MITSLGLASTEANSECVPQLQRSAPEQIVRQRLAESPYACLRQVRCEFDEGVLTLRGKLPSFFMMQVAQTIAVGVEGVELVSSHIEVPYVPGGRSD